MVAETQGNDAAAAELVPLLRERTAARGHATAYVCESYTCLQPVNTPEELAAQLEGDAGRAAQG